MNGQGRPGSDKGDLTYERCGDGEMRTRIQHGSQRDELGVTEIMEEWKDGCWN